MKERVFKLPNAIILNRDNLHPSTIGVALVFYAYMSKHRKFSNSLKNIATMAHKCQDTVRQAVIELESVGYIKRFQNFIYSRGLDRNVYTRCTYHIIHSVQEDYTLIPYSWLSHNLTPCTLQVLLNCRMFMIKEENRSFPSIRKMTSLILVAKSTVCQAIKCISELGIIIIESCKKENGAYSCNSYHMLKRICKKAVGLLGGKIQPISQATANAQITWSSAAPLLSEPILA